MKQKSITFSQYFQVIKPKYTYIKITPHKSSKNLDSTNIAKAITHTWIALSRRLRIEQRKLIVEANFKLAYIVDIKQGNAEFYFMVPSQFVTVMIEKIREIWPKAMLEQVESLEPIHQDAVAYQLRYKKEDALSIQVDRRSNEPLNTILNVMEIMQHDDRVMIVYNFMPRNQFGWLKQYTDTIEKLKEHKPIDREKLSWPYIAKVTINFIIEFLDTVMEVISDMIGGSKKKQGNTLAESLAIALESTKELSPETKRKKELRVVDTQIAVLSSSTDPTRRENNALTVCQAYRVLDGDNELVYKKVKTVPKLQDYKLNGFDTNVCSTDECQNFLQVPGRSLLRQFNLQHIQVNEVAVPSQLQHGYIPLGTVHNRETSMQAFFEDDYDIGNLPLLLIGAQGSGKSTFLANYIRAINRRHEGALILDYIKNCELADAVCKAVPARDLVVLDLSQEKDAQGLGFNEIKITDDMSAYERMKFANLQAQQTLALIDAINPAAPLTSQMRRYLAAACNVVYSLGYTSIRDVISCMENHRKRHNYIAEVSEDLKDLLRDEIEDLLSMDEIDKKSGEVVDTKSSKVEFVMDRINLLKEDFKLKYMFNKPTTNNIDLVQLMKQGKIVVIKMPQAEFPTKMIKNVLITYWICKKWLSDQIRGGMSSKPRRTHTIIDEVFQAPTSMGMLEYILPQSRKFTSRFVLSTQYMGQIEPIKDSLKASGCSYMFLKGTKEDDFKAFESDLEGFEYEDLRDMNKDSGARYSLNLIYYSGGYASFISKLPPPV